MIKINLQDHKEMICDNLKPKNVLLEVERLKDIFVIANDVVDLLKK